MKIYVAGKFEEKAAVQVVQQALRLEGHEITHDWTGEDATGKTGGELLVYLMDCARAARDGVFDADAIVVLNHPNLAGGLVEVGIAIGIGIPVLVVGAKIRENIFWHLPEVETFKTIPEALEALCT